MDISYVITPFLAWLLTGCTKFCINSIKAKRLAFDLIGYGGLPSTHSAIVSSMAALIAFKDGIHHPTFGIAITLAFIVMLDANSLRNQVGRCAQAINHLNAERGKTDKPLRERMGHSRLEIAAGVIVGILTAWLVFQFSA